MSRSPPLTHSVSADLLISLTEERERGMASASSTETAPAPPLDVAYARLIAWLTDRRILPPSTAWRTSLEKVHRQIEAHTSKNKAIACNIDDVDRKVLITRSCTESKRQKEREDGSREIRGRVYIHA